MTSLNEIMPKKYQICSKTQTLFESDDKSTAMTKFMNMSDYPYKLVLKENGKVIHEKIPKSSTQISTTQPING